MAEVLLLVAVAWALLAVLGACLLSAVRPALRNALLPGAPLVGVAFLVAGLHTTGLVLPARWGVAVLVVVALATLVVGLRRVARRVPPDRTSVLWTVAAVAVAVPFTLVALAPSLLLRDSGVVSPTSSNDAVWYVSVSQWLQDHSILDVPVIGFAPGAGVPAGESAAVPGDGPAISALTLPLRVGQELVQAALNTLIGTSALDTFSPWLAAWVLLLPGGCVAAAAVLGVARGAGLAAGVVMAGSAVLVQQVYHQNAGSVLGIALAPLVVAVVIASLDRQRRVPLLLSGLLLAGLVGTYTEYAPFVAPAIAGAVFLRRGDVRTAIARAAMIVGIAVAVAPLAWLRAAQTLIGVRGGAADAWPSPFLDRPTVMVNRLTGTGPVSGGFEPSIVGFLLAAVVVVGAVLAVVLGPHRGAWIGFIGIGAPFVLWLSLEGLGYTQRRAVELALPLSLFVAVLGWATLVARLRVSVPEWAARRNAVPDRVRAALPTGLVLLAVLPILVWSGVNVRSSLAAFAEADLAARHVDHSFTEAQEWVGELGGREGSDVSVLVPGFFDQQWLGIALADEERVEYPTLRADYFRAVSFWSGGRDRYWLVGNGVQVDADPQVVVRANARFRLLDLDRGEAAVVAPYLLTGWNTTVQPGGTATTVGDAQVLVLRTPGEESVVLTLRSPSAVPLDVEITAPGLPPLRAENVSAAPASFEVPLPPGDVPVVLNLHVLGMPAPESRPWIEMAGVRRDR